ncbi:hypothetical protein SBC1_39300 (plasmid) [Caballeronia sp. SBC1]|nr:hypothetical protein SBC2_48640 [Caballeronia sp. SBC2]QIN63890.1 hypothetical protein SBC1_39300 [Caballeronia sp. SBC1]
MSVLIALDAIGSVIFPSAPQLDKISTRFHQQLQQHHLAE